MPIRNVKAAKPFFMNGHTGHKYFYKKGDIASIGVAYRKARDQQKSLFANGYKVKKR